MQVKTVSRTSDIGPNVLLIVMDATRASSLSCYGYNRPTSPNLERFAEQCTIYETAISPGGWSLPGHASIFTGLYPSRHGAHEQHKYLLPEFPTLAELLRARGYHTAAFCFNAYVGPATGLDRGFEQFNDIVERLPRPLSRVARKAENGLAMIRGIHDSGARYINRHVYRALQRLRTGEQPFFLFVHYNEPHAPYRPPRKHNRYLPKGVSLWKVRQVNQDQWKYLADPSCMEASDLEILTALYDAELTYLDARIGELLHWLEGWGILGRTMVIVTADHGENIGEHQLLGHQYCLYDTLVHVPLIIHYPDGTTTPGSVKHQVQTLDLVPTVMAMLGDSQQVRDSVQGYDLLSSKKHEFAVAEWERPDLTRFHNRFPDADVSRFDRALKMIRTEDWKFIWTSDQNHELYNLRADPGELHNVIAQHPDATQQLNRRLDAWRASFEATRPSSPAPEFDELVKGRLRALGYLE